MDHAVSPLDAEVASGSASAEAVAAPALPADLSFLDTRFGKPVRVRPVFELYNSTKNLCIRLVGSGEQEDLMPGEPWATATLNEEALDSADTVALKTYSENAGLAELLATAGIIEPTLAGLCADGLTPLGKLTPAALKLAEPIIDSRQQLLKRRSPKP